MRKNKIINFFTRHIRLIGLGILAVGAVLVLSQSGFINVVTVGDAADRNLEYRLHRQGASGVVSFSSSANEVRRLVRKGSYEVLATQGNKGGFAITDTSGFLRSTTVNIKMATEKKRTYVGQDPSVCMYYTDRLYSYECGTFFSRINLHVPANVSTPTYVVNHPIENAEGSIEGIIRTSSGTIGLSHPADVEGPGEHVAYLLDKDLRPQKIIELEALDHTKSYSVIPHKSGFIVYSSDLNDIKFYPNFEAKPENIEIPKPDDSFGPVSLRSNGGAIVIVYSKGAPDSEVDVHHEDVRLKNKIYIYNDDLREIDLEGPPVASAIYCAHDRLCVLANDVLSIMNISGSNKEVIYTIDGALNIETLGNDLLVVRDKEILSVDTRSKTGGLEYSLEGLDFCGLQKLDEAHYLLCIIDKNQKSALLIDRTLTDTDSLDKRVHSVKQLQGVGGVSVYANYIFISLDVPLIYDAATNGYVDDPKARETISKKVTAELAKLGLNQKNYRIVLF